MTPPDLVDGYLQLTRQALTPSLELRERVPARLLAGLTPIAVPPDSSNPTRRAARRSKVASVAAGSALLALGFIAGHVLRFDPGRPPPLPRPSQQVVVLIAKHPAALPRQSHPAARQLRRHPDLPARDVFRSRACAELRGWRLRALSRGQQLRAGGGSGAPPAPESLRSCQRPAAPRSAHVGARHAGSGSHAWA